MGEVSTEKFFKAVNDITNSTGSLKPDFTKQFINICQEISNIR